MRIALTLVLLVMLAVTYRQSQQAPVWQCTPIDPLHGSLMESPCFRAIVADDNLVTLEWRVADSARSAYIYDEMAPAYQDPGPVAPVCSAGPEDGCSTALRVARGGRYRWVISVAAGATEKIHAAAALNVPGPHHLIEVTGGGFVDILTPTPRSLTWTVDPRNDFAPDLQSAWVEIRHPGAFHWDSIHYPRSGPGAGFAVPESVFNTQGQVLYRLRDCHLPPGSDTRFCSVPVSAGFRVDHDRFLGSNHLHVASGEDLELAFTTVSGNTRLLSSRTLIAGQDGQPFVMTDDDGYTIDAALLTAGVHQVELASCLRPDSTCSSRDVLNIIVDSPMRWQQGRDYTLDFYPGVAYPTVGIGHALDITFDPQGGIWQSNEFSNNVEHVLPAGAVESLNLPLGRTADPGSGIRKAVRPFTFWWPLRGQGPTSISSLAERAVSIDSKIWFTQGGGLQLNDGPDRNNHSRVIAFDPLAMDSPATVYDDRFCVYNMPADDAAGFGNNQIIGLTAARNRIWVAESRGLLSDAISLVSSFIPDPGQCDNLLDFEAAGALAAQALQYCQQGQTPARDGCMEKLALRTLDNAIKVAHLEVDPVDASVWFNDARGGSIGHIDPDQGNRIRVYEFEDQHEDLFEGVPGMGGFPWNLQVDESAVYTGEYSSRDILRFDKATSTYHEIHVPYANSEVTLHSLALDAARERLWFTLTNEVAVPINPAASTIGYIDLASWRAYIEDPQRNPTISGVIYRGLDAIAPAEGRPGAHQAFRGIAVDARSGRLALATLFRQQITVLQPRPGFWP